MNEKLSQYVDRLFTPYEDTPTVKDLKEELKLDLDEKMDKLTYTLLKSYGANLARVKVM